MHRIAIPLTLHGNQGPVLKLLSLIRMPLEDHSNHAAEILVDNIYCSVASCSPSGEPWNSPLYYSLDTTCRLFWASAVAAVHSRFLAENPRAFVSVFDSSAPPRAATGLYLRGNVETVVNVSIDAVVERHFARVREGTLLTGESYLNDSPERMYCFSPVEVWILGEPQEVNGHLVDRRTHIDLAELKQVLETLAKTRLNNYLQPKRFAQG